jgi:hypothetical protein
MRQAVSEKMLELRIGSFGETVTGFGHAVLKWSCEAITLLPAPAGFL